jgi:hypothetical protein
MLNGLRQVSCVALALILSLATAQAALAQGPQAADAGQANQADLLIKIVTAAIAGLGVLFGLPLTFIQFRKTQVEIRKLELESRAIEGQSVIPSSTEGVSIQVADSPGVNIQVLADPRLLGPLLLLLDFIIAWIVLALADYALGVFAEMLGLLAFQPLILGILGLVLLIPIVKEARRLRASLRALAVTRQESEPRNTSTD